MINVLLQMKRLSNLQKKWAGVAHTFFQKMCRTLMLVCTTNSRKILEANNM